MIDPKKSNSFIPYLLLLLPLSIAQVTAYSFRYSCISAPLPLILFDSLSHCQLVSPQCLSAFFSLLLIFSLFLSFFAIPLTYVELSWVLHCEWEKSACLLRRTTCFQLCGPSMPHCQSDRLMSPKKKRSERERDERISPNKRSSWCASHILSFLWLCEQKQSLLPQS